MQFRLKDRKPRQNQWVKLTKREILKTLIHVLIVLVVGGSLHL